MKRGNGEGTIIKTKDYWIAEYTLGYVDGKRKYKRLYGKTRKEVKEKLDKLIIELGTNTYVEKTKITLYFICKNLIEYEYKMNLLSDSSYLRKLETLKAMDQHYIMRKNLQDVNGYDVKDFLIYITKYSKSTISKIYGLTNKGFKKAVKDNIIKKNFLDDKFEYGIPKSLKQTKKIRAFTLDEQKEFLNILKNNNIKNIPYKYQFLLSMFTGMRMGEINALTLQNIDLNNNVIHIRGTITKSVLDGFKRGEKTKTYTSMRDIIIDNQVKQILSDYIDNYYKDNKEHLLFYDFKNSMYITTNEVNCAFKRLCKKYNIAENVNQHMLRHTFATRCIESNMPAHVLQKRLGHKSINITLDTYCDMFAQYQTEHINNTLNYLMKNGLNL